MAEEYLSQLEAQFGFKNEDIKPRYNGDVTVNDLSNWALSSKTCTLVNTKMVNSHKPGKRLKNKLERNKKFAILTTDTTLYPTELNINQPKHIPCLNNTSKRHSYIFSSKAWGKQLPIKCPSCWSSLRIPFKYVPEETSPQQTRNSKCKRKFKRFKHHLKKHNSRLNKTIYSSKHGSASYLDLPVESKQNKNNLNMFRSCSPSDGAGAKCTSSRNHINLEGTVEREHTYAIQASPRLRSNNENVADVSLAYPNEESISNFITEGNASSTPDIVTSSKPECKKGLPYQTKRQKPKADIRCQIQPRMTSRGRILKAKKYLD